MGPVTSTLTPVISSPGWELLAALEAMPDRADMDPMRLGRSLREQGVAPEVAAGVLAQLSLRDRAESKFGRFARTMVLTRDGLEQATRMVVAALHAQRFLDAGATRVADLGCGIGGDALAMAGLGLDVLAFDVDEDAAVAAAANLRAFPGTSVRRGDVRDLEPGGLIADGVDALFADPARRTGQALGARRLLAPEQWSPPLSWVLGWRGSFDRIGVKLAPGVPHAALPDDCHVQWTSVDGDLVEAALWTPALAPEGPGRSAQVIRSGRSHVLREARTGDGSAAEGDARDLRAHGASSAVRRAPDGPIASMIAEPDPAVIRAGLVARLAEDLDAHLLSPGIAWLTGDNLPGTAFASRFKVLDVVPLRIAAIDRALALLDIGRVEVKKRGADVDPQAIRAGLRLTGSGEATVIATRVAGRHRAVIARRCRSSSPHD
jgi:SAM-dependent methyltransferase